MVYPSQPPDDAVFVAIRGGRVIVGDPDEDLDHPADSRAPTIERVGPSVRPTGDGGQSGEVLEPADPSEPRPSPPPALIKPIPARPIPLTPQPGE